MAQEAQLFITVSVPRVCLWLVWERTSYHPSINPYTRPHRKQHNGTLTQQTPKGTFHGHVPWCVSVESRSSLVCICGEQELPGVYVWREGLLWCLSVESRSVWCVERSLIIFHWVYLMYIHKSTEGTCPLVMPLCILSHSIIYF